MDGGLYLYADIGRNYLDLLISFQARLQEVARPECLGELDFKRWRAFHNQQRTADAPFRFVDGELIERFLDLDEVKQEMVCHGMGPSVEDMRNLVEELRRVH